MKERKVKIPNPGSEKAIAKGCLCPSMDNDDGAGFYYGNGSELCFWITAGCPLHARNKETK